MNQKAPLHFFSKKYFYTLEYYSLQRSIVAGVRTDTNRGDRIISNHRLLPLRGVEQNRYKVFIDVEVSQNVDSEIGPPVMFIKIENSDLHRYISSVLDDDVEVRVELLLHFGRCLRNITFISNVKVNKKN
ncbi:hypothetical protein N7523_011055 [Penicillium sp. IBT 18751x]|nr:hypothetical protein N7523_011055 [Penicillium sp. IBT 18751x]